MIDARSVRMRRWTRQEYDQLVERSFFRSDERLELLDGLLLVKEPHSSAHMTAVRLVEEALRLAFGTGWDVRTQGPIALDPRSEPEPDASVVRGSPRDYRDAHPTSPVLVVEVALASLRLDRTRKGRAFARAGVTEYWIVNLVDRVLEVHREPVRLDDTRRAGAIGQSRCSGLTPLSARSPLPQLESPWPTSCRSRAVHGTSRPAYGRTRAAASTGRSGPLESWCDPA
jgi:Uma2 family endonuclease